MKGIHYITDDAGKKSAIVIDIKTYAEQLEEFLEGLEVAQRLEEPHEDYKTVMDRIIKSKK